MHKSHVSDEFRDFRKLHIMVNTYTGCETACQEGHRCPIFINIIIKTNGIICILYLHCPLMSAKQYYL